MANAVKIQEETTEKLNSLDNIFQLVFEGAVNNQKETREIHTKNKTLVKNFANVVLAINDFFNNNSDHQHAFKTLLDKRGVNLPSLDETNEFKSTRRTRVR